MMKTILKLIILCALVCGCGVQKQTPNVSYTLTEYVQTPDLNQIQISGVTYIVKINKTPDSYNIHYTPVYDMYVKN